MYGLPTIRGITGSSIRVGILGALNRGVYNLLSAHPKFGVYKEDGAAAVDVDTVLALDHSRNANIPDFRLQDGAFASYNKIQNPMMHRVTLVKSGSEMERRALVEWLEKNVSTPTVFNVVSNEYTFKKVSLVGFRSPREAHSGTVTRLVVDCEFREVRDVEVKYYDASTGDVDTTNAQRVQDRPTVKSGFCQTLEMTPKVKAWSPTAWVDEIRERLAGLNVTDSETWYMFDNCWDRRG